MAKFVPVGSPVQVFDGRGDRHNVIGWYSDSEWAAVEPVVPNPDGGSGVAPWRHYHGEDPWRVVQAP